MCATRRHLVRILETTDNINILDFTTYAIQCILQHYSRPESLVGHLPAAGGGGKPGAAAAAAAAATAAGASGGLYARLPLEVQAIVEPYLSSRCAREITNKSRDVCVKLGVKEGVKGV